MLEEHRGLFNGAVRAMEDASRRHSGGDGKGSGDVVLDQRLFRIEEWRFSEFVAILDAPVSVNLQLRAFMNRRPRWAKQTAHLIPRRPPLDL